MVVFLYRGVFGLFCITLCLGALVVLLVCWLVVVSGGLGGYGFSLFHALFLGRSKVFMCPLNLIGALNVY